MLGRKYEYDLIKNCIQSERAELGIVYGRRRVGKSTLLQTLRKETRNLYFEGIKGLSTQEQIEHFCKQLADQTQSMPVVARQWQDAFDALSIHISKKKYYVVFDEFPWMASEQKKLVSILKYYWDNHWKKNNQLTLMLCGSIAQFMIKHLVHSEALHNRKTFELKLEPLPAHEAAFFFKKKRSAFEIAKFLMIFGGIPKYLEQININHSLEKNMDRLCFMKGGFFLNEFETIFKEQFKVSKTYEAIVLALSQSKLTKEDLARKIKMSAGGGLTVYLKNLEQADFIRRELSLDLTGKSLKSKTARYALSDEWLRFYFAYMHDSLKVLVRNTHEGLFDQMTRTSLANYFGINFENFCIQNISDIIRLLDLRPSEVLQWGPYFQQPSRSSAKKKKGTQIDLLIQRRGQNYSLIECKFTENPVQPSIIQDVESKIKALKVPKKVTLERVLIAANGVHPKVAQADYFHKILTLDDFLSIRHL